jgi:hypothetical protein
MDDKITNLEAARFVLTLKHSGNKSKHPIKAASTTAISPGQ